ncbi:MAG: hypothetical protein ABIV25_08950 [Paracoccaceae bacterium]
MGQIADLEQRITSAFARIAAGVEALEAKAVPQPVPVGDTVEVAKLQSALDEERMAHAQLAERLKMLREQDAKTHAALTAEVSSLTRHLDTKGLDVQRLSETVAQLREELRRLREAAEQGMADPQLINRAMLAELEALRATRAAETSEMADILAALTPIVEAEEARAHA